MPTTLMTPNDRGAPRTAYAYRGAIEKAFGEEVDYGSIVKTFSQTDVKAARRYSPPEVASIIRCTPAMEAGVEKSAWTVADLVERTGE